MNLTPRDPKHVVSVEILRKFPYHNLEITFDDNWGFNNSMVCVPVEGFWLISFFNQESDVYWDCVCVHRMARMMTRILRRSFPPR